MLCVNFLIWDMVHMEWVWSFLLGYVYFMPKSTQTIIKKIIP